MTLFAHYIRTLSVQYFQAKSCIIWLSHMIQDLAWKYCTPEWLVIMITCTRQITHIFTRRYISTVYQPTTTVALRLPKDCFFLPYAFPLLGARAEFSWRVRQYLTNACWQSHLSYLVNFLSSTSKSRWTRLPRCRQSESVTFEGVNPTYRQQIRC